MATASAAAMPTSYERRVMTATVARAGARFIGAAAYAWRCMWALEVRPRGR
jgi:hypothetical protein